jgi:hypothetical protein
LEDVLYGESSDSSHWLALKNAHSGANVFVRSATTAPAQCLADGQNMLSGNFQYYTCQVYKDLDGGHPSGAYCTAYPEVAECCYCQQPEPEPPEECLADGQNMLSGNFVYYTCQTYKGLDGGVPGPYCSAYPEVAMCCYCQQRRLQAVHV